MSIVFCLPFSLDLRGVFAGAVESRAVRVLKKAAEEKASATKGAAAAPAKE
jgi:hypothetical protein